MWPTPKTIDTAPPHQENDKPYGALNKAAGTQASY
jgi:hypothetical protein